MNSDMITLEKPPLLLCNPGKQKVKEKILFIGEAVTLSHVLRPLQLASKLKEENKYEIVFACDPIYEYLVKQYNITYVPISSINSTLFQQRLYKGQAAYTYRELSAYLQEDLSLLRTIKPAIVVADFRISLRIATQIENVKHITLTNAQWSPFGAKKYPVPDHPIVKMFGLKIGELLIPPLMPFFMQLHTKSYNKLCRKNNVTEANSLQEIYTAGDITLYLDLQELHPCMEKLPDNHRFIGPLAPSVKTKKPNWWNSIPWHKPIIFLSLGSSGDIAAVKQLINKLSGLNYTILIATAGRYHIESKGNIYASDYLDAEEVSSIADLVICNGGSGMVYLALKYGIPVLGIPSNLDQHLVMDRIVKNGLGKMIRPEAIKTCDPDILIRSLLEGEYKKNAIKLKSQIGQSNCMDTFKAVVAECLIQHKSSYL